MSEGDFSFDKGLEGIHYATEVVYKNLREKKTTEEVLSNTEGFAITFANGQKMAKGALMRERAMSVKYKWALNLASKDEFEAAKADFCNFVSQSRFVD
jgi:hypothetical protein